MYENNKQKVYAKGNKICYFLHMNYVLKPTDYLIQLQAKGISTFNTSQFRSATKLSKVNSKVSIYRLKKKKLIVSPVHNFNIILPPEYRAIGTLPPEFFIDSLMKHLKINYYVGLLSASEKLGASHQKPQVFQVLVEKERRQIACGNLIIQFIKRSNLKKLPIIKKTVKTGYYNISSPELTAYDLVGYQKQSAGLQNVLTVLSELSDVLDSKKLYEVAKACPVSWSQRLGYLLTILGNDHLVSDIKSYVTKKAKVYIPLVSKTKINKKIRSKDWRIYINEHIEAD
jgi:hypothetical protein